MSDGLISKEKAYEVLTEYYHHKTELQHKALREALDMVPSADIDLSDYSDRLWRNAYEQGKAVSKDALDEAYAHGYTAAEADFHKKNQWIPVTERLPEEKQDVLLAFRHNMVVGFWEDILNDGGQAWYANSGNGWFTGTESVDDDGFPIAWMPLPEPWKGEDDAEV